MIKKLCLLCLLLAIFMSGGCVTTNSQNSVKNTMETARFIAAGVELSKSFGTVSALVEDKLDKIDNEEDRAALLAVKANLLATIKIIENWSKLDTSTVSISSSSVRSVYNNTKDDYSTGREILERHPDIFSYIARLQLENFDSRAALLDSKFSKLKDTPVEKNGEFVLDAVGLGIDLGRILIPLIREM